MYIGFVFPTNPADRRVLGLRNLASSETSPTRPTSSFLLFGFDLVLTSIILVKQQDGAARGVQEWFQTSQHFQSSYSCLALPWLDCVTIQCHLVFWIGCPCPRFIVMAAFKLHSLLLNKICTPMLCLLQSLPTYLFPPAECQRKVADCLFTALA